MTKQPRPFGTLQEELQIAADNLNADKGPYTPSCAILVVGDDPELNGAVASYIRGHLVGECIDTIPMSGFANGPNYHDYKDYDHLSSYDRLDRVYSESGDMLEAVFKSRPHLRERLTIAVDCVPGHVVTEQRQLEAVTLTMRSSIVTGEPAKGHRMAWVMDGDTVKVLAKG